MLETKNLSVRYGRHQALDHVSVKVDKGEICVILGANGAGKSSLLKAIAGTVRAEPGSEIVMNGKPITGMKAHLIVEEGVALVPEGRGIFGELTVAENLELGSFPNRARAREKATLDQIYALFPRLAERKSQIARTMSGGEQQMVAIGRALMSQPEILMLDEPSLGLSPVLTKELFRSLAKIAETGVGILLVEQNARQSLKIANRGYLIEVGRITGEGTAQSLMTDPAVVNAYLGGARGGAKVTATAIRLPAPFLLPLDLASVGRFIGGLALRAGAIRTAFVQALRQAAPLPSAFAGRYDPKKAGDPWHIADATSRAASPGAVAPDSKRVADHAAELAKAATLRHARHIRSLRASRENPSAFVGVYDPASALIEVDALDPAGLARAASTRLADHVRQQRRTAPVPSAFARANEVPGAEHNNSDPLLGHNSRGVDIEAEEQVAATPPQASGTIDIDALVSRATTIQSQHVAARRKRLTVVKLKSGDVPGDGGTDTK